MLSNAAKSDSGWRLVMTACFLFCSTEGSLSPSVKNSYDNCPSRALVTSLVHFYCSLLTPLKLMLVSSIMHLRFWMSGLNSCLTPLHDQSETNIFILINTQTSLDRDCNIFMKYASCFTIKGESRNINWFIWIAISTYEYSLSICLYVYQHDSQKLNLWLDCD